VNPDGVNAGTSSCAGWRRGFLTRKSSRTRGTCLSVPSPGPSGNIAPYFVEEVRQYLGANTARPGFTAAASGPYDAPPGDQEAANRAIDKGLRELDKRQGWRGPSGNVLRDTDQSIQEYHADDWLEPFTPGQVTTGVVFEQGRKPVIRIGRFSASVDPESAAWTGKALVEALAVGDIGQFEIVEVDPDALSMKVKLDQEPLAEGAFCAREPHQDRSRRWSGFDFERSKFNRATQARRQPGSAFKPFAAGAAIEGLPPRLSSRRAGPLRRPQHRRGLRARTTT
jgi:penicillin-binding protein 1A